MTTTLRVADMTILDISSGHASETDETVYTIQVGDQTLQYVEWITDNSSGADWFTMDGDPFWCDVDHDALSALTQSAVKVWNEAFEDLVAPVLVKAKAQVFPLRAAVYRVSETIHHGDYVHTDSATDTDFDAALRMTVARSPYYHALAHSEPDIARLRDSLHSTGTATHGWATYTLTQEVTP